MAQMHFYVPDDFAKLIRRRARQAHMPVSRYLVQLIRNEIGSGWPDDYFDEIYGGWQGGEPERKRRGETEDPRDL
jgi:hypothetical protein